MCGLCLLRIEKFRLHYPAGKKVLWFSLLRYLHNDLYGVVFISRP
jgi:hypothetical protein